MTNKKITDLVELTTPTTDDVFPLVDIATNSTKKAQLANLPISTATQTALDAKQATLVSGTNIKTINSTSLLGSGNISIAANPAGTAGQIQFNSGSAFAADSNLFWDNTNKRLGVGTSSPTKTLQVGGIVDFFNSSSPSNHFEINPAAGYIGLKFYGEDYSKELRTYTPGTWYSDSLSLSTDFLMPTSKFHVRGTGSTSATTSLLVQNSAGSTNFEVTDDRVVKGYNSSGLSFRLGNTQQGVSTRPGAFCVGYIDAGFQSGLQINASGANGYTFIDGWNDGGSSQFDIVIGNQGSRTQFGTSSTSVSSAQIAINSTTRGFLPPRMTTTQKNAISSPASGLIVYDTTTNKLCCYNGTSWNDLF